MPAMFFVMLNTIKNLIQLRIMEKLLKEIQEKVVEAITDEITDPRYDDRVQFIELYPVAEYNGIEIDIYMDERNNVEVTFWDDGCEVFNDELKKAIENTLPDWDLVRVDCETDGISRYDGLDPAFSSWEQVNGMFYRL